MLFLLQHFNFLHSCTIWKQFFRERIKHVKSNCDFFSLNTDFVSKLHIYTITITRYTPSSHLTILTFWPHLTTLRIESLSWMYILKWSYYALLQSLDFVLGVYLNMLSWLVVRKSHNFSQNLHYYNSFLPSLAQKARLIWWRPAFRKTKCVVIC